MLTLVLAAFLGLSSAVPLDLASCPFPNNSDTKLWTYGCDGKLPIQVGYIDVSDDDGNVFYPIDPEKPFVLTFHANNTGEVYTDNKADVKIFLYSTTWDDNSCHWTEIPTLGLLNNIDGCDIGHNCPLTVGNIDLKIRLELSQFQAVINLLAKDKPYELDIRIKNANPGSRGEEIACVKAQIHLI